jgi:indole-3-glycerol phosphate synthase/phosphoribosylanthranilate isomerase
MALEDLINRTRAALKQRARDHDVSAYIRNDRASNRSLANALSGRRLGYIFECERALTMADRTTADFDATVLARTFAPLADAISLTTNQRQLDRTALEQRFEQIEGVRESIDLPVVLNDVIVDSYQIYEARHFGADAVTLMPAVLDEDLFTKCAEVARSLDVDIIAVIGDRDGLERALAEDIDIIGVDARDFDRGEFDIASALELAKEIPDDRIKIVVGGVSDHRQATQVRNHVDAVLTGSTLPQSGDVPRAMRQLVFGRVKVCGLAHAEHAQAAWEAGATYGGIIFAPGSARHVTYDRARAICAAAPLEFVGVFVDDPMDDVACCAQNLSLRAVQLHGSESNDYILGLRKRLPEDTEIWKALHVHGELPNLSSTLADRVLLDNFERGLGASNKVFDWSLIRQMDERSRRKIILGGGLTPDNASRADEFGTWALDVNLGVESSAGIKSRPLLDRFFAALRGEKRQLNDDGQMNDGGQMNDEGKRRRH